MWLWPQITLVVGHLLLLNLQLTYPTTDTKNFPLHQSRPPPSLSFAFGLAWVSASPPKLKWGLQTRPSSSQEFIAGLFSLACKSQISSLPRINVAFKIYTQPHDCSHSLPQPLFLLQTPFSPPVLHTCFLPTSCHPRTWGATLGEQSSAHPQLLSNFSLSCCSWTSQACVLPSWSHHPLPSLLTSCTLTAHKSKATTVSIKSPMAS